MKKNMDTIKFENRNEIRELIKVIDQFINQNPNEKNNKILECFFDLLDVMDIEW